MTTPTRTQASEYWDEQYRAGATPWDSDRPSSELERIVVEYKLSPCRAVELGCGTGASAVWLAAHGFQVTAMDLSPTAIRRARARASRAGTCVHFLAGDLTAPGVLRGPFDFFFDRGCYHAIRLSDPQPYFQCLKRILRLGALGLVLVGNAAEPEEADGPPVMEAWQVREEWGEHFAILRLRAFRFDPAGRGGKCHLGWSCLVGRAG
jgi:SAM-dependent methyltransferase